MYNKSLGPSGRIQIRYVKYSQTDVENPYIENRGGLQKLKVRA